MSTRFDSTRRGSSSTSLRRALDPLLRERIEGLVVGQWVIEGELARGAVGAVFRAHGVGGDSTPVALKVLLAGEGASATQRARLRREAEALSRLDHPHVVRPLEAGETEGFPWIAMELVEGKTLGELRPDRRELVRLLAQAARGLEQAHARGVIHRDLKPANVLVTRDGRAVVADFGLASVVDAAALTRSGALVGTPGYMSPEQAVGDEVGPPTDVHALGVMLYEGLTGQVPFAGENVVQVLTNLAHHQATPPRKLDPSIPLPLERACLKALAKRPEQRHAHAGELAAELEAWLGERVEGSGRVGPIVLASLLLLLLGVGAAVWILTQPPSPSVAPPPAVIDAVHRLRLQPGPIEGKDAVLRSDGLYANDNFGPHATLRIGDRADQPGDMRAILEFDTTFLPPGAQVRSARLGLWVTAAGNEGPLLVVAQRVIESPGGRTPWVEGTGGYDEELDGVCWDGDVTDRASREPSHLRSRRPELGQPDLDPAELSRASVPGQANRWVELDVTAAVTAWAAGAPRHGVVLRHEPEGAPHRDGLWLFASSDHARADIRPWLEVEWLGQPARPLPDPEARRREAEAMADRLSAGAAGLEAEAARERLSEAVRQAPHLGRTYLARARLALGQSAFGRARLDLLLARGAAAPADELEVAEALGELAVLERRWQEAREQLGRVRRARPDDLRARAFLAAAEELSGNHALALEALPELVVNEEVPWIGVWARGRALLARGEREAALSTLRVAVAAERQARLFPAGGRAAEPALELAGLLRALGRAEEARLVIEEARRENPDPRLR